MTRITTFAAALALTSALTSGAAFAATKVGVIGAANPQVFVQQADGSKKLLNVGDDIFLNDTLSTDGKGSAQLMFLDKSALTISPESAVKIDEFVYDPAAKDGTMTVSGAKGAFRFIGGALTKKKAVNLKTPVSTIGIRGGIVDTHIEAGGETDAVFLFGKEMTMTNAAGQTTSTTQFGSGIGLDSATAVPTGLPANVVAGHIAQSPSQAAVAASPPASAAQLNAVESKVDLGSQSKAAEPSAAPAAGTSGDNAPASSNEEGSTDEGAANTPSEGSADGSAAAEPSGDGGDGGGNAPAGGSPEPAASGADAATPAPTAATAANADAGAAPAAPTPAAPVSGLGDGAGMKPLALVANPVAPVAPTIAPAATSSEAFYGKVNQFVNAEQSTSGETRKLFNVEKIAAAPQQANSNTTPLQDRLTGQPQPQIKPQIQPQPLTPLPDLVQAPPTPNAPTPIIPPVTFVTPPPPQNGGNTNSGGGNTTTTPWHELAQAPTQSGKFVYRDNNGNSTAQSDDAIELSYAAAYKDGNTLKLKLTQTDGTTGGYGSALSLAPTDDSRFTLATIALPAGSGLEPLYGTEVTATDMNGSIAIDSVSGSSYVTADNSFIYAQTQWIDQNGTIGNYTDDSTEYLRGYVLSSLMDGVADTPTAQSAYATMLTNAAGYASATSGIIEYDFLPDLMTTSNDGKINYNRLSGFGSSANTNGLFVDYTNKKFLGGDVVFSSASPSIQMLFGSVNDSSAIGFAANQVTGKALDGAFFTLNQSSAFNATNNSRLNVEAKAGNVASGLDANDAIEALIIETHTTGTGAQIQSQQAAVIGTGASTSGLLNNDITATTTSKGFTAGLITDSNGNVSRIKSAGINDVTVTTGVTGDALATINYYNVDTVSGSSLTTGLKTINFGSTNSASPIKDAALQKDLYAAEVSHVSGFATGTTSKGAIVSMHDAVSSQANLVCSTCEFSHWGVWQADHIDGATTIQQTALVPYVAGQATSQDALNTLAGQNIGDVVYNGNAAANIVIHDGANTAIHNAVGTMTANVDLTNRQIASSGLNIQFNDIGGSIRDLAVTNNDTLNFSASNGFAGGVQTNFTDANGISTGNTAMSGAAGNLQGAFFGTQAEEIGGNYYVQGTTVGVTNSASESIKAGGIFLGKRP